jgi:predicted kinase
MRAAGAAFSRHADDQEARYGDRVPRTGTESTRLVILRGNSASGKSSTAAAIRARHGRRDLAIVGQDHLRRVVLREHDVPGGANIGLIDMVARYALHRGFHTIVEGIFRADHYAGMLTGLRADYRGLTLCYYFDVPFNETMRRHAGKPQVVKYGEAEMRGWYRGRDLLPGGVERIIPASSSLEETVRRIVRDAGLARKPPASA